MLFRFDSAVGQRRGINGRSFGAAITVGYHAKWGVLALPGRWDTVITLDYATGSSPLCLHCWLDMDMLYFRVLFFFAIVFFLGQESAERRGQGCNANRGYDKALIHQSIYRFASICPTVRR